MSAVPPNYGGPPPGGYVHPAPPAGPRPVTLTVSVWLLFAGGVLTVLGFVANLAAEWDALRAEFLDDVTTGPDAIPTDTAETILMVVILIALGITFVMAAVWWALAVCLAKGMAWARIVSTVIGVPGVLLLLCGSVGYLLDGGVVSLAVNMLLLVVGVASLVLMWLPDSSRWIRAKGAARG